jgi:hypothetical protein
VRLELDYDFLRASGISLDTEDLRLGLSLGLISPLTALAVAVQAVEHGASDPTMLQLAHLDRSDIAAVREALRAVDPEDADLFPPQSVRKWTYLELRAAYDLRDRLTDPLGFVEQVYADFDYPASVAEFVRYMPPPPDAAIGEAALFDRWSKYLAAEAAELSGEDG